MEWGKSPWEKTGDRQGRGRRGIGFPEVMAVAGKKGVLERAARLLDLPGDVVAGLPRIELIGSGELRMEQHQGILAYSPQEIHISGGGMTVRVRGRGLELRGIDPVQLLITGEIHSLELS